jgi:hypothetical protein
VQRECIWRALKERCIPKKFINLVKEGYSGFQFRILHNGQLTELFQTISGVCQGRLLSPLLFLVALDGVLNEVFSININTGRPGLCQQYMYIVTQME